MFSNVMNEALLVVEKLYTENEINKHYYKFLATCLRTYNYHLKDINFSENFV